MYRQGSIPSPSSSTSASSPQNKKKHRKNLVLFRNHIYSGREGESSTDLKKTNQQEYHPCVRTFSADSSPQDKRTDDHGGNINKRSSFSQKERAAHLGGVHSVSCEHLSMCGASDRITDCDISSIKGYNERRVTWQQCTTQDIREVASSQCRSLLSSTNPKDHYGSNYNGSRVMSRIRANPRFRRTIDNSECNTITTAREMDGTTNNPVVRKKRGILKSDRKSLSMDSPRVTNLYNRPEGINPMFLNYEQETDDIKLNVAGCVVDESSTDPPASMDHFDIVGPSSSTYPWQREVGIQCELLSLSSHEDLPEVFDSGVDSPGLQSQMAPRSHQMIRHCLSLDTGQKYHDDPAVLHNRILEAILERENVKRRVHSSSDVESETGANGLSKTYSASSSKSPSSILKNSRTGSGGNIHTGLWTNRPRVYASTSNLTVSHKVDILPSPPLSPCDWTRSHSHSMESPSFFSEDGKTRKCEANGHNGQKPIRRKSSDSVNSNEEESDTEPSPTMARQGRRKAIFDSRALGVISAPDGDQSPSNSCDESDNSIFAQNEKNQNNQGKGEKKFQDDLSTVRRKKVLIKRNTVHDFASNKSYQSVFSEHDSKKNKSSFSMMMKLIDKKGNKAKDSLAELPDVLQALKPTEFKDQNLISYKSLHWSELIASKEKEKDVLLMATEVEVKRREAVWELFKSECVFLVDHLMVLKHCFLEPMKKVQVEGHLMFAEPQDLFGNLDELCYVSYTFCKDFISLLLSDARVCDFGRTQVLVKALQRLSQLSRDGEVYHDYCLNYSKAVNYLEILRKNDRFCEFERWCENDPRCHRLQLADLLISPMQHCTKVPLLLFNIRKYTEDPDERQQLTHSLEKLEKSLKKLEAKMDWLKNFERVQEIQQQIQWPPVTELDPRAYIPEFLKPTLTRQPCEKLLASPKRQLLHEGPVTLLEISKALDMYMFLFDDILLLTKFKKQPRKKSDGDRNPHSQRAHTDGAVFVVHKQPIALDRFTIHDVKTPENAANGLRHAFVLVQISRFQQVIGVYTLQAHSEVAKEAWMAKLTEAQAKYKNSSPSKKWLTHTGSLLVSCEETIESNSIENSLTSFLEKKEGAKSLGEKSNRHEPIIGDPRAISNQVKMKDDNNSEMSTSSHTEEDRKSLVINQNKAVTDDFGHAYNDEERTTYKEMHSTNLVVKPNSRPNSHNSPKLLHTVKFNWENDDSHNISPSTVSCPKSSQQKQVVSEVQEHSTQTEAFNKRHKPKLVKQQTTIGIQQLSSHVARPSSLSCESQQEEALQRIKHLVSPTKLRTHQFNGNRSDDKHAYNSLNIVTNIDTGDTTAVGVTEEEISHRKKEKRLADNSWEGTSPDDIGDGGSGEQDKSPLLGKHHVESTNTERVKEIQKIRKLTRLKAIQEKNQSVDIIYI